MRSKRLTSATDMMRPLQIAYNIRMNKINEYEKYSTIIIYSKTE